MPPVTSNGYTSVTVPEETRDRLAEYEHGSHDSVGETLDRMMRILPSPVDMAEGCTECGDTPGRTGDVGDVGGMIEWFSDPHGGEVVSNYFCSKSCQLDYLEMVEEAVPTEPDKVFVGGKEEVRFEIEEHTRFMASEEMHSVEFDIPVGIELYEGEPVYVVNAGEVRFSGVVRNPSNIDGRAYCDMEYDREVTQEFYPDGF